jgi:hypothetical protein
MANDCVVVALAAHFGVSQTVLVHELEARSPYWRQGKGVEMSLTDELVTRFSGVVAEWRPLRSGDKTGLVMMIDWRDYAAHIASVVDGRLQDGSGRVLGHVGSLGVEVRWLPVERFSNSHVKVTAA